MAHHDVTRSTPRQHTASDAAHRHLASLLALADVRLDGSRPWDIHLLAHGVPERVLAHGNLGLGESFMDGLWTCERLDQLFDRLLRSDIASRVRSLSTAWHHLRARWLNLQTEHRAWQVGRQHYDLGNAFYAAMLDRRMTYTCAFWDDAHSGATTCARVPAPSARAMCNCGNGCSRIRADRACTRASSYRGSPPEPRNGASDIAPTHMFTPIVRSGAAKPRFMGIAPIRVAEVTRYKVTFPDDSLHS